MRVTFEICVSILSILTITSLTSFVRVEGGTDNSIADVEGNSQEGVIKVGEKPDALAVHSGTNRIYVANVNSNTISIIDGSANKVIKTISSGGNAPMGLAVNPVNNKVYVANFESNSVSVLDGKTGEILANITNINYHPYRIAINPSTNFVYVASIGSFRSLSVINSSTDQVVFNATLARGDSNGIAVNPDTNIAYVTHDFSNVVSVIDLSSNQLVETLMVGDRVFDVAVNPATDTYYVLDSGHVSAIDGSNNRAIANVTTDGYAGGGIAVNAQTNKIYVPNGYSNATTVIDGATNTISNVIELNSEAFILGINPQTNLIYIASQPNVVMVIDGMTNAIVPEFGSSLVLIAATMLAVAAIMAAKNMRYAIR